MAETGFDETPADTSALLEEFARAGLVNMSGGCCGTTPDHIRAIADKVAALPPRGDRHCGTVHGVARDQADAVMALDDAAWLQRLQHAIGWRAGRLLDSGPRSAYPLIQVLARALAGERAVLLGNAAQTIHPPMSRAVRRTAGSRWRSPVAWRG
ncbi:hypothetical protein G6F54_013754 [Rhizopus delemar]|nr:hypothetical protein G6F54_013754 [Rhizopus delemar]